jgi:uncharacterized protein involved in exopolysaccharide biosynthesis
MNLEQRVAKLEKENAELKKENAELKKKNVEQRDLIEAETVKNVIKFMTDFV